MIDAKKIKNTVFLRNVVMFDDIPDSMQNDAEAVGIAVYKYQDLIA